MTLTTALYGAATGTTFKPTDEQLTIIDAAKTSSDNLQIDALAGAAKTSTLVLVANDPKMQATATLALAFNKKIAEEMKGRLPSNCVSMTLNSLGHRVWSQTIGRACRPSTKKNYEIMSEIIKKQRKDVQTELFSVMSELLQYVAFAKASGFIPSKVKRSPVLPLWTDDDAFLAALPEAPTELEWNVILATLRESVAQSFEGNIDFDDQILMPTVYGGRFPTYPLTMIDEAQDLSQLNHEMLAQIVGNRRLFAVGDPCQAIYGFRGAHADSMDLLRDRFNMKVLHLTTTFRCPKAVAEEARWRAPHINSPSWAKEGAVKTLSNWSVDSLPQDAVLICRNNAPLYNMAIRLLLNGRFPQIVGNDIGRTLLKALSKLGDDHLPAIEVLSRIEDYERERLSRAREHAKAGIKDFCQCLRIFCRHGSNLGDIKAYANHLINLEGPVKLMTIHKSKGLEFRSVFILDRHLCRIAEGLDGISQDHNLLYVAQTRAQEELTYIRSDEFVSSDLEEV